MVSMVKNIITNEILRNGGGTYSVRLTKTGIAVESANLRDGYMVSDDGVERIVAAVALDDFTIGTYIGEHYDAIIKEGAYLGAWEKNGRVYLDVSRCIPDVTYALSQGVANGQLAIWDNAKGEEIDLRKVSMADYVS